MWNNIQSTPDNLLKFIDSKEFEKLKDHMDNILSRVYTMEEKNDFKEKLTFELAWMSFKSNALASK